jgi:rhodanese-related sulfurtransferase
LWQKFVMMSSAHGSLGDRNEFPSGEYGEEHLPGAINIPLKELDAKTAGDLRPDAPVIVYCYDYQ